MERETGIEPATNSLEGCDSTTELLPPTRLVRFASLGATAGKPASRNVLTFLLPSPVGRGSPTEARVPGPCERRWVAREGFEPSKPLGRQIYSLLRLTASLPRPAICSWNALFSDNPEDCVALNQWSWRRDLNPRPADYKSAALPD